MPNDAMTQPIVQGIPSANAPTIAEPKIPVPYCGVPTSAETAPARSEKLASASASQNGR
jgi:hypothetical protein